MSSRRLPAREHPTTHAGRAQPSASDDTSGSREPGLVEAPPTWTCASEAVDVCLFPPNRRRIGVIALVVGSLLVAVNQGGTLASGHMGWVVWVRVALDYLIPTCVSTLGVLAGSRRNGAGSQRGAP
ncbi:MAG: nitrate/nitrite transporter NrtS [Actinomycetota bacterium]|nr:nitrate/nitrite transporter NrtS [Actinomycetota bacterium]